MAEDGVHYKSCGFGVQDVLKEKKGSGAMDKCLLVMEEDVASWLSRTLNVEITVETLMSDLDTGVVLCCLANMIQKTGEEFLLHNCTVSENSFPSCGVTFKERTAFRGSFIARDNVANFIRWCRELGVPDIIMFETEDLVLHKNEKSVILTLMEVARLSVKFGFEPPDLVRLENEIDQEIEEPEELVEEPIGRLKKRHKSHSLDDLVYQVLDQCTCPVRYPVLRIAEGKYRVGENKSLIFVRVMRKHVMVRVGGGWDTLERYFDKHDPCKVSERQRRGSLRPLRTRSGSDVIGRSPSTMSMSSTDSYDSTGPPVTQGGTASGTSAQGSPSQESGFDQCLPGRTRRMNSLRNSHETYRRRASPTRSPTPDSPRQQQRTRRGLASRDTPPRTIQTQSQGRLSRKSKSMQELSSYPLGPSYSKPTTSSTRRQSQSISEKSPAGTPRRQSSAISPRKLSAAGSAGDAINLKNHLSSCRSAGPPQPGATPARVSRSASFGSRPRPMKPVMESRDNTPVDSRPSRDTQRKTSKSSPRKVEKSGERRTREPSGTRRSSATLTDGKPKFSESPGTQSTQGKHRKPSVPQQKTQPARKHSRGTGSQAANQRTLPTTPETRKGSTSPRNLANSTARKERTNKTGASVSRRKENKPTNQSRDKVKRERERIIDGKANETHEKKTENGLTNNDVAEVNDLCSGTKNGHVTADSHVKVSSTDVAFNFDENSLHCEKTDDMIFTLEVTGADETCQQNSPLNVRKTYQRSSETESDVMSDLTSEFTDTDYDARSQRYSGLSEASSDVSFGHSPAWRLFHSAELERSFMEPSVEPVTPELGTSPTVKDCLTNLKLQESLTPIMRKRIFDTVPPREAHDNQSDSPTGLMSKPDDKAKFFDVEKYKDLVHEGDDFPVGSPRKRSLVRSLISSIENRGSGSCNVGKVNKSTTPVVRAVPERVGRQRPDEPAVVQREARDTDTAQGGVLSSDVRNEDHYYNTDERNGELSNGDDKASTLPGDSISSYMTHDINRNVTNALPEESVKSLPKSQPVPGEQPLDASDARDEGRTRRLSRDKRGRVKDVDVFPRPQRQFTLEEMIQDMMPTDGEAKGTGDQRVTSAEPRFQAWF